MSEIAELKSDSTELKELLQVAKRPRVKDVLKNELASVESKIGEMESKRAKEEEKAATAEAKEGLGVTEDPNSKPKAAIKPTKEAKVQRTKITNYGYDEKDNSVTIYIGGLPGVGGLEKDQIKVEYKKNGFSFVVSNLNGKTHELDLPNLAGEVIPEKCKHKVKPDEVRVILKKAKEGKWGDIMEKDAKVKDAKKKEASVVSEADKDKDPSESLMDMMKKMYDEGDDEMKKTIAKAWTESREKQASGMSEGLGM